MKFSDDCVESVLVDRDISSAFFCECFFCNFGASRSEELHVSRRNPCMTSSRPFAVEPNVLITASLTGRRGSPSSALKRHAHRDLVITDSLSSLKGDKETTRETAALYGQRIRVQNRIDGRGGPFGRGGISGNKSGHGGGSCQHHVKEKKMQGSGKLRETTGNHCKGLRSNPKQSWNLSKVSKRRARIYGHLSR